MKRTLRCTGYVIMGIAGALLAIGVLFAVTGALFWLSMATTLWFDLPDKYGMLFFIGYIAVGAGATVGISICRETSSHSSTQSGGEAQ